MFVRWHVDQLEGERVHIRNPVLRHLPSHVSSWTWQRSLGFVWQEITWPWKFSSSLDYERHWAHGSPKDKVGTNACEFCLFLVENSWCFLELRIKGRAGTRLWVVRKPRESAPHRRPVSQADRLLSMRLLHCALLVVLWVWEAGEEQVWDRASESLETCDGLVIISLNLRVRELWELEERRSSWF